MKYNYLIFTLFVALIINLRSFGQCNDTLKWVVFDFLDYSNNKLEPLEGKTFDLKDNPKIIPGICITNVSDQIYSGTCDIGLSLMIDDDFTFNGFVRLGEDYNPTDSGLYILTNLSITLTDTGKHIMVVKIVCIMPDIIFCDSIQELSSMSFHFNVINSTGINEFLRNSLSVFPNPANNQITLDNGQTMIKDISIYDIMGREIRKYPINETKSMLDVSNLQSGMYFLKITTEQGILTRKVQVIR